MTDIQLYADLLKRMAPKLRTILRSSGPYSDCPFCLGSLNEGDRFPYHAESCILRDVEAMFSCLACKEELDCDHLDEHMGFCCDCFDISFGMPVERINEERAGKDKPPFPSDHGEAVVRAWSRRR